MKQEQNIAQFNKIIRDKEEDDIAAWLIQGLIKDGDFEGLLLTDERSYLAQLQELFDENKELNESLRKKFKNSLILAVSEWSPTAHGAKIIRGLAILGAYIRASRIIDHLSRYILDEWLSLSSSKEEDKNAVRKIFAVLAGFAPNERVRILFKNLFFKSSLPPQFAAQIFLGLCKCDPFRWVEYVPTFIEFFKRYSEYYEEGFIIYKFEQIVSLSLIAEQFKNLHKNYIKDFLKLLCSHPKSPLLLHQLFLELYKCAPRIWAEYMHTFIDIEPSCFPLIEQQIEDLDKDSQKDFLKLVCSDHESISMVQIKGKFYLQNNNNNKILIIPYENNEAYYQLRQTYIEIEKYKISKKGLYKYVEEGF